MEYIGKWYYAPDLGDGQELFILAKEGKYLLTSYYYEGDEDYVGVWYKKGEFTLGQIKKQKGHNDMVKVLLPMLFEE